MEIERREQQRRYEEEELEHIRKEKQAEKARRRIVNHFHEQRTSYEQDLAWVRRRKEDIRARGRRIEEKQCKTYSLTTKINTSRNGRNSYINIKDNNFKWNLTYSTNIPDCLLDVKCVAIASGGYIAVYNHGSCSYHGIPDNARYEIERQKYMNISYIALGEYEQYYIRKTNGRELYNGCEEFMDAITNSNSRAELVSFGDYNTYFLKFEDNNNAWSENLEDILSSEAFNIISNEDNSINFIWLGQQSDGYRNIPYFISYATTTGKYTNDMIIYKDLPLEVEEYIYDNREHIRNNKSTGSSSSSSSSSSTVKQVFADNEGHYFFRYS